MNLFIAFSITFLIFPLLLLSYPYAPPDRTPIWPYLSGDTFRAHCNHAFDELNLRFIGHQVKPGDKVFVSGDKLGDFFLKHHPTISSKYILVSHNSDASIPGPYAHYLDDDKIIIWFGQNLDRTHPKLRPLPIALENRNWKPQNVEVIERVKAKNLPKIHLLYCNFSTTSYLPERPIVHDLLAHAPFSYLQTRKNYEPYIEDLASSQFVLSPRGNGLDTHRVWEALYVGSYPIVKTSPLDELYSHFPVVIVHEWKEITEEFLHAKYEELNRTNFDFNKLFSGFWFTWIDSYKNGL